MLLRLTPLLICLFLSVNTQDPNEAIPVSVINLKNIVIEDYHGSLDANSLELFENVQTLTLKNCNFSSFSENFLHPLKNIEKLVMSNNHFNKVKHDISSCCMKLKHVEAYGTSYGGPVSKEDFQKTAAVKPLQSLYWYRLDVPTLYSKALAGSNLKSFAIEQSNMATIEDGAFDGMDKLEVLSLKGNKLEKFPPLSSLKDLKELNLEGNLLKKVTTEDFPVLPNLEKVNLGHNPVKEIDLKGLKEKLPKLKQIDVTGIDIDPAKNEGIPWMTHNNNNNNNNNNTFIP